MGFVGNFMNMMFAVPAEDYKLSPTAVKALELMLILTLTTSKMRAPPRSGWQAPPERTRTPVSQPVSPRYGDPRTAAPTKQSSTCWWVTQKTSTNTSLAPKTKTIIPFDGFWTPGL